MIITCDVTPTWCATELLIWSFQTDNLDERTKIVTHRVHLEWSLSQQQPNYSQKRQFPLNSRSLNQQNYTLLLKIYIYIYLRKSTGEFVERGLHLPNKAFSATKITFFLLVIKCSYMYIVLKF